MTSGSANIAVLHVVSSLNPAAGGPSYTVTQLTDALASLQNVEVSLISQVITGEPVVASDPAVARGAISARPLLDAIWPRSLGKEVTTAVDQARPAIIHCHGLWRPINHMVCQVAHRAGIPVVVHPRGMLEPWALAHKKWKKQLALALYQRRDLRRAAVFFASASMEYESIRALGLRQPVAVIPNGVARARIDSGSQMAVGEEHRTRTVLFLSRVHPKKGLINLIEAWSQLSVAGWKLVIAGGDDSGHLQEVMDRARSLGVCASIECTGELSSAEKTAVYSRADLFVLPSFSENFGVVVAEALAHGVPVITTRGTPWSDLDLYDCGWWIDIGVQPLRQALLEAMSLTDAARKAMGVRGREYVARYDWKNIAQQTLEVYRWVLHGAPPPDTLVNE